MSKGLPGKTTSKIDSGKTRGKSALNPPMSSVVVERHTPVTKV